MSFICDPCLNKKYLNEPEEIPQNRSVGACEDCGLRRDCSNIPHSSLVLRPGRGKPKKPKTPKNPTPPKTAYVRCRLEGEAPMRPGTYTTNVVHAHFDINGNLILSIGPLTAV